MMRNIKAGFLLCAGVGLALFLSSCVSMREVNIPDPPEGFKKTDIVQTGNERFVASRPVEAWWQTLGDEQLNFLVSWALDHNKDVGIAKANLQEARSLAREYKHDRYLPRISSDYSYQRIDASEEGISALPDPSYNSYEAGVGGSWEVDLFGRVTARIDGAKAREQASLSDLRGVYVVVAAEVARNYMSLRGFQHRLDIARRNADNQRETYELTKRLTDGGRGTQLDVSRALTQLELTQSTIPALEAKVSAHINRLSVLTGQIPDALRDVLGEVKPLPDIPVAVNLGNVADLLQRRPDIVSAERRVAAAISDYNFYLAYQLPVVNIIGSLGFVASSFSDFGATALASSVGPSVSWAVFDLGRVRSRIDQADARAQKSLVVYEKTVLEALEELQTAISDFSREEERRAFLQKAARSSKESAVLARRRYEAGVDTFLDVLNAEATLLEAEDLLAQSEAKAASDIIAVYKALGGGWQGR